MSDVFLYLLNQSLTAGYLILAVLALRLLLRKVPKRLTVNLWALVALRLAFPISVESALSLIPKKDPVPMDIALSPQPAIDSGIPAVDRAVNPVIAENLTPVPVASVNPMQVLLAVASVIWLIGVAGMLVYALVSYLRLSRRVGPSLRLRKNIYLCDAISSPFLLGIVRPRIYLPSDMEAENRTHVLRHERAHLRHRDHWWKPLGFVLLAVYWFQPLVWIAYILFCRDLEMACDERAVADLTDAERKAYSHALLSCAAPRHAVSACPVAFGENSVKSRIKNVLRYKKTGVWIAAVVAVVIAVAAVCFLTNPKEKTQEIVDGNYIYTDDDLRLEFTHVVEVQKNTIRAEDGEESTQTTLIIEPGTSYVVHAVDPERGWHLAETTGTWDPIPITRTDVGVLLSESDFYLANSDGPAGLILRQSGRSEEAAVLQETGPIETVDGDYTYTNGNLQLEFKHVVGKQERTIQGENGREYPQTVLFCDSLAGIRFTVHSVEPESGWQLRELTGLLKPISLDQPDVRYTLSNNEFCLENTHTQDPSPLVLRRYVEAVGEAYIPATAQTALACDLSTGENLYAYQADRQIAPGDLNKLALALVVLENHDLQELVDTTNLPGYLKEEPYRRLSTGIHPVPLEDMGEMTVEDLTSLMLMRGIDEAAYALARFDAGSEKAMVEKMNALAKSVGSDTRYTDIYGVASGQYTTASDTLNLLNRALANPGFAQIWTRKTLPLTMPGTGEEKTVFSQNYLMDDQTIPEFYDLRVTGGLAFWRGQGNILCTARENGREVLCVLLGAQREYADNGWQILYYGDYQEMGGLLNAVFAS